MDVPEGGVVGEPKLGFEGVEDLLFDLLHRVTAESANLQRLAELSVPPHCEQHLQPLNSRETKAFTVNVSSDSILFLFGSFACNVMEVSSKC